MLLPRGPAGPLGMIRRRQARAAVAAHFDALGIGDIHLDDEIGELDLAIQQKIEIARALFRQPRILLLDEPTSTLSGPRRRLARRRSSPTSAPRASRRCSSRIGCARCATFCDTMTVLRNGKHIATGPVSAYADDEVIRMIAGRSLAHAFPPRRRRRATLWARRCSAPSASRRQASCATPPSACGPARSSASPACRAWDSSICFSPASAWPI